MERITVIEGADLRHLLSILTIDNGVPAKTDIYKVRIAQTATGIKVKVNEGMWTPALGKAEA